MRKIKEIAEIMELAKKRKCVYTKEGRHHPAAFVIGYQTRYLFNQIKNGFWFRKEKYEKIGYKGE